MEVAATTGPAGALALLEGGAFAVRVGGLWSQARCRGATRAVNDARMSWTDDWAGTQFSLGRAWYTHLEQGRTAEYFADAAASDTRVESALPGLQDELRGWAAAAVGEPVARRRGFCGAGVHVFPASGEAARHGGVVHFDTEGLTPAQRRGQVTALSLVLMLHSPTGGGGLRLWDVTFPDAEAPRGPHVDVPYEAGDLVLFSSYRLHQILPFDGDEARISATLHAARAGGSWESWF